MTAKRLRIALACLAALAVGAGLVLTGEARLVVWIFLAGLAAKSWIAYQKEKLGG
jgi:hypothetical protein